MLGLLVALLAASPQPVAGGDVAAAPSTVSAVQVEAAKKPDRMVCRLDYPPNSRIAEKICAPQSLRDSAQDKSRDTMRQVMQKSGPPPR